MAVCGSVWCARACVCVCCVCCCEAVLPCAALPCGICLGCVAAWLRSCMALWLYGSVALCVCVCVCLCVCGKSGSRAGLQPLTCHTGVVARAGGRGKRPSVGRVLGSTGRVVGNWKQTAALTAPPFTA